MIDQDGVRVQLRGDGLHCPCRGDRFPHEIVHSGFSLECQGLNHDLTSRADMASSMFAPFLNTFTQSAFAQNVGLVAISGVKSRFVVTAGGGILVVLGLFPLLGRVVAAVPTAVLGGAGIVLFGSVAAAGIRTLSKVKYEGNLNLVIVSASIAFGCLPIGKPDFYGASHLVRNHLGLGNQLGCNHGGLAQPIFQWTEVHTIRAGCLRNCCGSTERRARSGGPWTSGR